MKKLNKEDKKILLENQKEFYEQNNIEPDVSNFRLRLWFHKLNRYAKKYNIDLIAIHIKSTLEDQTDISLVSVHILNFGVVQKWQ